VIARDFSGVGGEGRASGLRMVEGDRDHQTGERRGNFRAVGSAVRERPAAGLDQQQIHMPVVAAVELEDLARPVNPRASRMQAQEVTKNPSQSHSAFCVFSRLFVATLLDSSRRLCRATKP